MLTVGDGEDDRAAAAAFGCAFVGVVDGESHGFEHKPVRTIATLTELPSIVQQMNGD